MKKSDSCTEMMMAKNKRRRLHTEQEVEAALQLIQLKNYYRKFITSDQHVGCRFNEPFMNIVLKSKEFLKAEDIDNNNICNGGYENIKKRKSDGIASCSSSLTFDRDDSRDEDATEAVGYNSVKKKKNKFRSIVDIYNVTKPL